MCKTKIIATIGPASNNVETIKELINAGMDAARINFSHGSYESIKEMVDNVKQAREELNIPIPLILDTKGPEIRLKTFANEPVFLKQGERFVLTTDDIEGDETRVAVTYKDLPQDVRNGSRILIDDGLVELKVVHLTETDIECVIVNSGPLSSRKGVNIPDVYVNLPALTEKDEEDIKFGIEQGFDYVAASFIRSAADVIKIREIIENNTENPIKIIAKIENRDGVNNIDSILEVSDGIMVARGDLGVEIPPEEVPLVQKHLISSANHLGKIVITATQMLESMVTNLRPTRAEANDVANAIFDGTDVIMLSGESAKGNYPVESVAMMNRIAVTTEHSIDYLERIERQHRHLKTNLITAIGYASCTTANDLGAACIVTITNSGITPRILSKFRPNAPICAITKNEIAWRQLNLSWGCIPILDKSLPTDEASSEIAFNSAIETAKQAGLCKDGDYVVLAAGIPVGIAGTTNLLKVEIVGNILVRGEGVGNQVVTGVANTIKVFEEAQYFKKGEILVTTKTTDELIPYIKRCSALIVGSDKPEDYTHTQTLVKALDIPVIICNQKVVDLVPNGCYITVDSAKGFVYNGDKIN